MKKFIPVSKPQLLVYGGTFLLSILVWKYVREIESFTDNFQPEKLIYPILTVYAIYSLGEKWNAYSKNCGVAQLARHFRFVMMILLFSLMAVLVGGVVCSYLEFQNLISSGVLALIFSIIFNGLFRSGLETILITCINERDPEMLMLNGSVG